MPVGLPLYRGASALLEQSRAEREAEEQEELSLLSGTGQWALGGLARLGAFLDIPGAQVRGALAGKNPLDSLLNVEDRVYGKDLFKQWGIGNHGGLIGEMALELALDPLMYLSGGISAIKKASPAGKMLVKSGAVSKMGDVATVGRSKADDILAKLRHSVSGQQDELFKRQYDDMAQELIPFEGIGNYGEALNANRLGRIENLSNPEFLKDFAKNASGQFNPHELKYMDDWIDLGLGVEKSGTSKIGTRRLKQMLTGADVLEFNPLAQEKLATYLAKKPGLWGAEAPIRGVPGRPGGWWGAATEAVPPGLPGAVQSSMQSPLGPHMSFGVGKARIPINRLSRKMDAAGNYLGNNWASRAAVQAFSRGARGAGSTEVQRAGQAALTAQELARTKVGEATSRITTELPKYNAGYEVFDKGGISLGTSSGKLASHITTETMVRGTKQTLKTENTQGQRLMRQWFEMPDPNPASRQSFQDLHGLSNADVHLLETHRTFVRKNLDDLWTQMRDTGMDVPYLRDKYAAYFPRRMVKAAYKANGRLLDVDDHMEWLAKVEGLESRVPVVRMIKGGTGQISEILTDERLGKLIARAHGGVPGAKAQFRTELAKRFGPSGKDVFRNVASEFPATESAIPAHLEAFSEWMFNMNPAQRDVGFFGHHPLADLKYGMEAGADAVASNTLALELMGKYAKPAAQFEGAKEGGMAIGELLNKLGLRGDASKLFDEAGQVITQTGPRGEQIPISIKHIIGLKDNIAKRLFPAATKGAIGPADAASILNGYKVPNRIANDLMRLVKMSDNPGSRTKELWDGFLTLMKTHLTTPHPAFAGRNWLSGQFRNMVMGLFSRESRRMSRQLRSGKTVVGAINIPGMKKQITERGWHMNDAAATKLLQEKIVRYDLMPVEAYGYDAINNQMNVVANRRIVKGLSPIEQAPEFIPQESPLNFETFKTFAGLDEAAKARRAKNKQWYIPGREFLEIEGAIQSVKKGGGRKFETHFGPAKAGKMLNQWIEGDNRVSPFIKGLLDGWDESALVERIMGGQVDYASRKFTRFERTWMQSLFPFYKFRAGQLKFLPGEIAARPGGPIPQTVRAMNTMRGREQFMPEYLAASSAVQIPEGVPFAPEDSEVDRYIRGFGFMFEDPLETIPGVSGSVGEGVLSSAHPFIKGAAEWTLNRSAFQGGRELGDIPSAFGSILQNVRGVPYEKRQADPYDVGKIFEGERTLGRGLEHMLMNSPLSRYITTAKQLTSPIPDVIKGDYSGAAIGVIPKLTGLPSIVDVNPIQREAIKRQRAQEILQLEGKARSFERVYVPQATISRVKATQGDHAAEKLLLLQEILNKLADKARKRQVERLGGQVNARKMRASLKAEIDMLRQQAGIQ